ncbi:Outer membrane protein assembly factor BamE, lipoprotein component of the BamABCDE complex [Hymenobacter daecheongensis DSM 21074]|uniref:Outer membrane protein assembly factor BamE, lipoprotein component of the BamABCDE complex n=1 Tax=Hymenobacter daecheongensis DSM 21074 TaxID=1121955 RepID=A0A1M6FCK0_9BACT|nr:outer membrane protein assembly factor BamE [Hymenobacter daecheongensis]SHI95450.1 Outer membrane protein assembly factor BamE, lipoprotein component of the BamABCDE complex [Hymenobacter daecheongensis DSM 21074]
MLTKTTFSLLALAATLLLPACTAQESFQNAENCAKVEAGMSQEQVRRIMGAPTGSDAAADSSKTWSYLFGSATDTQPIRIQFGADGKVASVACAPQASGSERPTGN